MPHTAVGESNEEEDFSGADWTMYDIISSVARRGRGAWIENERSDQKPLIRRILYGLLDLSEVTGWPIDTLPGRLGCKYVDKPVTDVSRELLEDSARFLDGLLSLLDRAGGRAAEAADLIISVHAVARRMLRDAPGSGDGLPPGSAALAVTVLVVTSDCELNVEDIGIAIAASHDADQGRTGPQVRSALGLLAMQRHDGTDTLEEAYEVANRRLGEVGESIGRVMAAA